VLQAVKLFTDDVAIIPLYHFKNIRGDPKQPAIRAARR